MAPFSSEWDSKKLFPLETVRRAAEMGFCSLVIPTGHGGLGLSRHDTSLVFEALSYGDVPVTAYLTIHAMVSGVVTKHGSAEQKRKWLPKLAAAETLSAYALTEPSSGSDAAAMRTTAKLVRDPRDGSEWFELSGEKVFISGGGVADLYLVMAKVENENPSSSSSSFSSTSSSNPTKSSKTSSITAFLIEKGTKGLSFGAPEKKMGWNAQPTTSVSLDKVKVRARDSVLGGWEGGKGDGGGTSGGGGFRVAMQALDGGRVNIGAISVGGGSRAVDVAREYCRHRTAFGGKTLSSFQATQFSLSDAITELCASRCLVREAARAIDESSPVATFRAAAAKRLATDAASRAADAALQRLGGYGYLQEYGLERLVRDLRVHQIVEGTNEIQRVVMWRELERMDGVGGR